MTIRRLTAGLALICLFQASATATPSFGQTTAPALRARVNGNVTANQWGGSPLFNLQIQSSSDNWGYDIVQIDAQFGVADASGRAGSSGWHSHQAAITMVQVIQGTGGVVTAENRSCVTLQRTGSVFFEKKGNVHHLYNMDPALPLIIRVTFFIERYITVTRTDEPEPLTGSPTDSAPPPTAVCDASNQ